MKEKLIVAIDKNNFNEAFDLCQELKTDVGMFKLGLEFFLSFGAEGVNKIAALNTPIFLDLKLHDIPNTVSKAAYALLEHVKGVEILTIHASGGIEMMSSTKQKLIEAEKKFAKKAPQLFGITVLTSTKDEGAVTSGWRTLFPYAMVAMRAIIRIKKLMIEFEKSNTPKKEQEESLNEIYNKLQLMVENANNSLIYWENTPPAEKERRENVNKMFKEDPLVYHLNLQFKCEAGSDKFYKANLYTGVINSVLKYASLASSAGIAGVVSSALEVKVIKDIFPSLKVVTPGIMPAWYNTKDDQSRVLTPQEAITNGSDYLVIGRPITEAANPSEAAKKIFE